MCGRVEFTRRDELVMYLGLTEGIDVGVATQLDGRPTMLLPVVTNARPRLLQAYRWGLIPSWVKLESGRLPTWLQHTFNAVSEQVRDKPAFRSCFQHRRCVVPVDAYFEWTYPGGKKRTGQGVKHRVARADEHPLLLAGLWDQWNGPAGQVSSFTVLTVSPYEQLASLHHRMPVVLERDAVEQWLLGDQDEAGRLMRACSDEVLTAKAV